jgi:hypothetical protein
MRFRESAWHTILKRRKAFSVELLSGGMARKSMTLLVLTHSACVRNRGHYDGYADHDD